MSSLDQKCNSNTYTWFYYYINTYGTQRNYSRLRCRPMMEREPIENNIKQGCPNATTLFVSEGVKIL